MIESPEEEWKNRAACAGMDVEIFYPEIGGTDAYDEAREICAGCRVRSACLEYAIANHDRDGMWGGYTDHERRRIIRKRRQLAREAREAAAS